MATLRSFFLLVALCIATPSWAQFVGGFGSGATATGFGGQAQLPLTLLNFDAELKNDQVALQWSTIHEIGTSHFVVERTADGNTFSPVGRVSAAGMSPQGLTRSYHLTDAAPLMGSSLYRLKSVDLDGSFTYSELVEVNREENDQALAFAIRPNPSTGSTIGVGLEALSAEETLFVEVLDLAGRQLVSRRMQGNPGDYLQLELKDRLPAGTYFLRLSQASTGSHTSRLIVGQSR
ncbi:T9SS type A sorting domain-containing protein [Neolewinella litorea]|nr:T9SS type A sorting domain-containing protein [Neolewinella litorea]